ncbi:UDP-N-acetylmuramoyl-L-alanyl-D-glutamate--2,6-diaminopimelate ligase [uncultured archaeon]|nr:UDP-N-acetylmuramoyl-L-alanyl-D-glutamate--2,6-diaminopimelate ligase [uncultured archaeon]
MDYGQAVSYLNKLNLFGSNLGLDRERALLSLLGQPQRRFTIILVGGTSGKGSTTAMISSILQSAGYRTGRLTKPHLARFSERICVDGKEISERELARLTEKVRRVADEMDGESPTFFEVLVAIALCHFAEKKVDFAVLEVGLGGRLDATNVCDAPVSVITNISLEHAAILGNTVAKIAREKAGIVKEGGVLVTAASDGACNVFRKICRARNARMVRVRKLPRSRYAVPLLGDFQMENAACAVGAAKALEKQGIAVSDAQIRKGLAAVKWPGRMEIVQKRPLVIIDCAKDENAMIRLRKEAEKMMKGRAHGRGAKLKKDRLIVVLGISSDKEWKRMLRAIVPAADVVVASEHQVNGRAVAAGKIAAEAERIGAKEVMVEKDLRKAVKKALALAASHDLVLVAGSVFTAGEAREIWFPSKRNERNLNETPGK